MKFRESWSCAMTSYEGGLKIESVVVGTGGKGSTHGQGPGPAAPVLDEKNGGCSADGEEQQNGKLGGPLPRNLVDKANGNRKVCFGTMEGRVRLITLLVKEELGMGEKNPP